MMAVRFLRLASLYAAASLATFQPALSQEKPTVIGLSPYLGVIWSIEADVAGKKKTFLFDTAGGISVITPETAAEIGCKPWGQLTGFRMRGDRIDLQRCENVVFKTGGAALSLSTVGVWDFGKVLPKNAPPVAGSIALDSLAGRTITLDLSHRTIIIETPASLKRRIAHAREVELRLGREVSGQAVTPFVSVRSAKGKLWMELDTGSDAELVVGRHNAELFGMKADSTVPQGFSGRLEGGVKLETDTARTMPLIIDGNIGAGTLEKWIVTLDLAKSKAWIAAANP